MKKFSIVFVLFLIFNNVNAQLSQLNISTYYHTSFDLYLDGQLLVNNASDVSISDITPGTHLLQLKRQGHFMGNTFHNFQQPAITFFQGNVNIPANTNITAMVYQGQLIIQNQVALAPVQGNPYDHINPNFGQAYGQNPNYIPGMNTHWNVPPPHQSVSNCPNIQQPVFNYGPQAMAPQIFQQLKSSIDNQSFSSGQMSVFNQALATNYFTATQVKALVESFTFSSDQLQVAKRAYTKTIDPQNYFIVNDALEFSSSVSELSSYIASL